MSLIRVHLVPLRAGSVTALFFAFLLCAHLASAQNAATPAAELKLPPGFRAELVRSAQPDEGSWVCMTIDAQGRLIISPQAQNVKPGDALSKATPMLRVTLAPDGKLQKLERIEWPVGAAMGLLYAFDSLYVNGQGPDGTGIYRLRDTNGDDQFDDVRFLKRFEGTFRMEATGEHGPHAIVLGPDNMLYVINGNETKPPEGVLPNSPHKNFQEDQLLPPQLWPANYTWANGGPPGGCVYRTDPEGKEWTLIAGGLRNAYDLAFNRDGEMFTFDSDMDWDDGSPWYRPTRVNHLVSGGEYGWRKGTGKWPEYYPDSLKSTLDLGRTSPTGLKFGTGSQFPQSYRRALYLCDWAFGTIYAVQFTPSGASYKATAEKFITGKPLNVTDLEIGRDGAMYFITGGRGTQSGLYRVTYDQPIAGGPVPWTLNDQDGVKARQLRHQLEAFHGKRDPAAIDFAWPHLDSADRSIRYAARIAIEWQDVALWQQRALAEDRPTAAMNALLALARCGDRDQQGPLLKSLGEIDPAQFTEEQTLDVLRVLSLSLIRMGRPKEETIDGITERLLPAYPSKSEWINRELCRLLVYLDTPGTIGKTMKLLAAAPTQEEQMHYVFTLRHLKRGWTPEQRAAYFNWFPKAAKNNKGSNKFIGFLVDTRNDAIATLTERERSALGGVLLEPLGGPTPTAAAVPRKFVKEWTIADLEPALAEVGKGRSFVRGKELYAAVQCAQCHRFGDTGGAVGPDITAASSRFNRHDLLETIVLPSKVISDQFQNTVVVRKNGEDITGRVLTEDVDKVVMSTNPLTPDRVEVPKRDIKTRQISKVSPMPEGLLNVLTREEILDLLAYIESGGNASYSAFQGK
jgi:putative heme-binding domain-containing protein